MTLAETIALMVNAGCTREQVALAAAIHDEARRARAREGNRQRQAAFRASNRNANNGVTDSDTTLAAVTECDGVTPRAPTCAHVQNLVEVKDIPSQIATLSSAPESKKRATRLPESWRPSEAHRAESKKLGLFDTQLAEIAEEFRNYWLSEAGQRSRKLDWDRTFLNRLRDQAPRYLARLGSRLSPQQNSGKSVHAAADRLCEAAIAGELSFPPPPSVNDVLTSFRNHRSEDDRRLLPQGGGGGR